MGSRDLTCVSPSIAPSLGATVRRGGGWQVISQEACDQPSGARSTMTGGSDI